MKENTYQISEETSIFSLVPKAKGMGAALAPIVPKSYLISGHVFPMPEGRKNGL